MARKHIPLVISRPAKEELLEIQFEANATGDEWKIPYRYPFADIKNYTALKDDGYFRHATTDVSTELGGSAVADAKTNLGFQLPITEKLILLVKVNTVTATSDVSITITGSTKYKKDDVVYTIPAGTTAGTVFEIDLYNFGLYIENGEVNIAVADGTTPANDDNIDLVLVARMA